MERKHTDFPLYRESFEHDACGIGAVISIRGEQSRRTVDDALKIVEKLQHRAGKDACGETGDGVGLMMQIPHKLMVKAAAELGLDDLGAARSYGVGMFFFPQDTLRRLQARKMLEIIVARHGVEFLGWREVPVCPEVLGRTARDAMPCIQQCFVRRPEHVREGLDFDRLLYIIRREFEQSDIGTYIASFSSRTVVYKGMFLVDQLRRFYRDLQDPDCESAMAMVHSRFSTNTNPSWERAHPNRYIMHNGEINTIRGNVDRMLAREETMHSPVISDEDMDRRFGLGHAGQHPRVSHDERHRAPPGRDDDDPRALGQRPQNVAGEKGFLSVLRHHARGLGRPGRHRLLRRRQRGRGAGPQRPAPLPLVPHAG